MKHGHANTSSHMGAMQGQYDLFKSQTGVYSGHGLSLLSLKLLRIVLATRQCQCGVQQAVVVSQLSV